MRAASTEATPHATANSVADLDIDAHERVQDNARTAQQLGISDREAARQCGLEERRYAHYAGGRREPDLETLVRIAKSLGTTPNWLLGLDAEGKKPTNVRRYLSASRWLHMSSQTTNFG